MTRAKTLSIADHTTLIRLWRLGDVQATEQLYDLHRNQVYRLAMSLLHDASDAEDVAQEALSYALLRPELYHPSRASLATWLHQVVVSRCKDHRRKQRRSWSLISKWWQRRERAPSPDDPEQVAGQKQSGLQLRLAVQELPEPLREALVLRIWGGHSYREISTIVGCPLRTAQSRVRLALEALRSQVDVQAYFSETGS